MLALQISVLFTHLAEPILGPLRELPKFGLQALAGLSMSIALITPCSSGQSRFPPLPDLTFASNAGGRKAYVGENRWSYMAAGNVDAPAVVMLHGSGGNSIDWRFQLTGLSDRFRTLAWNAPGYMLTDGFKAEKPACREYADALADFLDASGLTTLAELGCCQTRPQEGACPTPEMQLSVVINFAALLSAALTPANS